MSNQKIDFHEKVSSTLLRRLAEAADGHRGSNHWLVFSTDEEDLEKGKGHYIKAHKKDADADGDLPSNPKRHRVGPFFTESWGKDRNRKLDGLVVHTSKKDGTGKKDETFQGDQLDSLFWSESVIDKILIPYYVGIYGLDYGKQIREAFNKPEVYALTHLPGSEYVAEVHKAKAGEAHPSIKMIIPR